MQNQIRPSCGKWWRVGSYVRELLQHPEEARHPHGLPGVINHASNAANFAFAILIARINPFAVHQVHQRRHHIDDSVQLLVDVLLLSDEVVDLFAADAHEHLLQDGNNDNE